MKRTVAGLFSFALMLSVLVAALWALNRLPSALQKETLRRYKSIEDVRDSLKTGEILVPSFFPQRFDWPPARIFAQGKPFRAVIMEFRESGTGEAGLVIVQSSRDFHKAESLSLASVKEDLVHDLKGRKARLQVGLCRDERPCSRLSWDEGGLQVAVVMKSPPFELIRMAESMIR